MTNVVSDVTWRGGCCN